MADPDKRDAESERALRRIENGIAALVRIAYFPTRCAFDGVSGAALEHAISQERINIDQSVERMMNGEILY